MNTTIKPKNYAKTNLRLPHPETMSVCFAGGGGYEYEPVPSVLMLSGPAGSLSGLHGALLLVP